MAATTDDGSVISPFPLKIVTDILSRLPIKSLLRFESVSKPFASLIKSPEFAAAHLRRHSSSASLLIRRQLNPNSGGLAFSLVDVQAAEIRNIAVPFLHQLSRLPKIVGSCCGLVCLDISLFHASAFVLWNLVTGKYSAVPSSAISISTPAVWMVAVGFGSDRHSNDIKIVRIVYFERRTGELPSVRAEVYSWGLGVWSLIDTDKALQSCTIAEGQKGVTVNGALHWVGFDICKPSTGKLIVSFDLDTEKFSKVRIPDSGRGNNRAMYVEIMGLEGKLALAMHFPQSGYSIHENDIIELWSLDDMGGNCWTKISRLSPSIIGIEIPLGIFNDSELITKYDDGDVVYIIIVGANGRVKRSFPMCNAEFSCEVFSYIGSLFPVARELTPWQPADILD
ncbi:F-box/kelch-repeat protein At3g06240 [Linum grandiflorum]